MKRISIQLLSILVLLGGVHTSIFAGPFPGANHSIPGTIELEKFDTDGQNKSYYDATPGNAMKEFEWFDKNHVLRDEDGADVDMNYDGSLKAGPSYIIGFVTDKEWMKYTIGKITPGRYKVSVFYATPNDDDKNKISIDIKGEEKFDILLTQTGGWTDYKESSTFVNIKNSHVNEVMKVTLNGDEYNIDKLVFALERVGAFKQHTIPGRIQAEDFDIGPNRSHLKGASSSEATYNDLQDGNQLLPYLGINPEYREGDGVDIGYGGDEEGYCVGWVEEGEWLKYTMNTIQPGNYNVSLRISTNKKMASNNKVKMKLGNKTIAEFKLPNSGGWSKFINVTIEDVEITSSNKKELLLSFEGEGNYNFNWLEFVPADGIAPSEKAPQIGVNPNAIPENKDFKDVVINYETLLGFVFDYSVKRQDNKIGVQFKMPTGTTEGLRIPYSIKAEDSDKEIQQGEMVVKKGTNKYVFELAKGKYEADLPYVIEIKGIVKNKTHRVKFKY